MAITGGNSDSATMKYGNLLTMLSWQMTPAGLSATVCRPSKNKNPEEINTLWQEESQ
jgi:hypothetical protein